MFSLICVWINDWVNNRVAGDLRRYRAHYDVIVMMHSSCTSHLSLRVAGLLFSLCLHLCCDSFPATCLRDAVPAHRRRFDKHLHSLLAQPTAGIWHLAPVPLSIFRSNSKFDENSKHSSVKYTRPITTIFCTRHDSITVVSCATYRCDRSNIFETRAFWIFIEFWIRSKYA